MTNLDTFIDFDSSAWPDNASRWPVTHWSKIYGGTGTSATVTGGAARLATGPAVDFSGFIVMSPRWTQFEDQVEFHAKFKWVNIGANGSVEFHWRANSFPTDDSVPNYGYRTVIGVGTGYSIGKKLNDYGSASTPVNGASSAGTLSRTPANGDVMHIKIRLEGGLFRVRAWFDDEAEPTTWPCYAYDSTMTRGALFIRLRGATSANVVMDLLRYKVSSIRADRYGLSETEDSFARRLGDEQWFGTKTFVLPPVVPTPTAAGHAATKAYVDAVGGGTGKADLIETVNVVAASGATQTIPDVTTATMHKYTLTANCTFTMPTAAAGKSFSVSLAQDATGGRTATFTGVKWAGGTAPTFSTGANKIDDVAFVCTDPTVGWKGYVAGLDMR